jgi:hypothetical protein
MLNPQGIGGNYLGSNAEYLQGLIPKKEKRMDKFYMCNVLIIV